MTELTDHNLIQVANIVQIGCSHSAVCAAQADDANMQPVTSRPAKGPLQASEDTSDSVLAI
jgi:hypothetical protein